ncbi:MAG TPA: bifunctional glutamate N-acetyltransferase/amino-acid acetyltransferase ArgJ [Haliangiales bacterium]|nr:bifunctional glutamate N-acetyltransferase/amino-acid acetyltransferase ArgJ [Haliangiales bacterium]
MTRVRGFRFAGVAAGIKPSGKKDIGLVVAQGPAAAAGAFTQNRLRAAPVDLSAARLKKGRARGVVVVSGNANACTGPAGARDAAAMARAAAEAVGAAETEMLVASTGVIGVPLPMPVVLAGVEAAAATLSEDGFGAFSEAILTTDKAPKVHVTAADGCVVAGCAKGAGMIAPNMATALAFVMTDALVKPAWLRAVTKLEAEATFNRVSVDGDTSTNDSLFVLASGAAGACDLRALHGALHEVMEALALMLVREGEGAKRVVTIWVTGASSGRSAERVARRIATSPLVKTAIAGADPNWGRILAAVGNAGVAVEPDAVSVDFDEAPVVRRGIEVPGFEPSARQVMLRGTYEIRVSIGAGDGTARVVTCDLTHEYIDINASYRS